MASMTRRRLLLFGVPVVAVALTIGVWSLLPVSAITRENAARIQAGMTLTEVEAILGGPARDETTGPVVRVDPPEFAAPDSRGIRYRIAFVDSRPHHEWQSDEARISVHFGEDGRVTDSTDFPMRRAEETLVNMLRRWLHL
jgi:hypothetical protein